jgi:hypothetical protein
MKTEAQEPLPEITVTKVMREKMKQYGVELREGPSKIKHLTYGTETTVSPSVFAVFEIAIKANYIAWMLFYKDDTGALNGCMRHHQTICANCSPPITDLPFITTQMEHNVKEEGPKHSDVYRYCSTILGDAGLYYDLLD